MNHEQLQTILNKYDITLNELAVDTIIAISHLPTSEIVELFNEIVIEDVFSPKEKRLF